tara:strand:+ start:212 stop:1102 length:891 start_codon:yes stop_codon:yes gene_type:complete
MILKDMAEQYRCSPKFCKLSIKTQKEYMSQQKKVCATIVQNNVRLGDMKLKKISLKHVAVAYEQWLRTGTRTANMRKSSLSVVFKYAMQNELMDKNPLVGLETTKDSVRSVKWERDEVKRFLDIAYGNFKYRNIALLCQMAYDFGQRLKDMRQLKWCSINFIEKTANIKQSKRGAEVHLPIDDKLIKMLEQQKEDFDGVSEYVCPRIPIRGNGYREYSEQEISYLVNDIKREANIRPELWAMDFRRTAVTEMVESDVDVFGIMQVTGHQNPQSVKNYLVNTREGATTALSKRNANG